MTLSTLFQQLTVEPLTETQDAGGNVKNDWVANGVRLTGALSTARANEQELYQQDVHDQIYTFVTEDVRYDGAKTGDRLRDARLNRVFYVRGIDDDSSNQQWCSYFLALRPGGQ